MPYHQQHHVSFWNTSWPPLSFGYGPPQSVLTPSHTPQPIKTTRAGSKPLCQDSTQLGHTNTPDTQKEGVFRQSIHWNKSGRFDHWKVQNATNHRARNSSQKCVHAFGTLLLDKCTVLCTDVPGSGSEPPLPAVPPERRSPFPRLCTPSLYQCHGMPQCFLAQGAVSSLSPLQGLTQLLINGNILLALNLPWSFAKLPSMFW